jgi:hypothetical protein
MHGAVSCGASIMLFLPKISSIRKRERLKWFISFFSGEPARTVGWRDPGFIHTAFMRDLWPNKEYVSRRTNS